MSTYSIATNGANQLVQNDGSGNLPALSAVNLTDIPGANITAGTVPSSALDASGTPSATTFLRGDDTWSTAVTSVGLSAPALFTVLGSPVTTAGTLALGFAGGQTANQVLATPDGTTGPVGLRNLVVGDLPSAVTTQGNSFNGTSQLVQTTGAGILPVLDGSNLTNLSGANIASASIPGSALVSGSVTGTQIASSVALAGSPTTTTQSPGDNSTKIATTGFVETSFAPLASPALTGTPTAPTAASGTNTTQIATTAFVSAAVAGSNPPIRTVKKQIFTSSGTYTPSAGMLFCYVRMVGGGGGGVNNVAGQGGGGGGGGQYAEKTLTAATVGSSQAVTIGAGGGNGVAGGSTSLGSLCAANGGATANTSVPGAGGSGATSGDFYFPGQTGRYGSTVIGVADGQGGSSPFGYGAFPSGSNGEAGTGYGAGGGGGGTNSVANTYAGGAGTSGVVLIEEYCSE